MPLSKENLVDHEFIPVGPLMPLAALIGLNRPDNKRGSASKAYASQEIVE
jgi:hypothetical protein